MRRPKKRRRTIADALGDARRDVDFEKRVRAATNRANRVSRPSLRANDERDSFSRCLVAFYGEAKFGDASFRANPRDIPKLLGREDEFWAYWQEWSKIRPETQEASNSIKQAAARALAEYF